MLQCEIHGRAHKAVAVGSVSLRGELADQRSIHILRDTTCSQSVILASSLPFSEQSAHGYGTVLHSVEMGYIPRPVHRVYVQSKLVTGFFPVTVFPELPIEGNDFLMGNAIPGGKVTPALRGVQHFQCRDHTQTGNVTPSNLDLYPIA